MTADDTTPRPDTPLMPDGLPEHRAVQDIARMAASDLVTERCVPWAHKPVVDLRGAA